MDPTFQTLRNLNTEEQYEAVCDFAVMFPVSPPAFVAGDSDAYDLARVAKMDAAPRKSLFGLFGYPRSYEDRNIVDYAAGAARSVFISR